MVTREAAKRCVGKGWHGLVDEAYDLVEASGMDVEVLQVKEKFGGLRIYWRMPPSQPAYDDALAELEARSFTICERCGAPGTPRRGGWVKTLCTPCSVARSLGMNRTVEDCEPTP